jgi:anti-anti-sigma factor
MQVKIDTKEKFTVVSPLEREMTDNLAADWYQHCKGCLNQPIPHIVLNMSEVGHITPGGAALLVNLQQQFYESGASFVICCLQEEVESLLEQAEVLEQLSVTPTESEAWDIVQMEEIERELLDDDHPETHQ